MWIMVGDSDLIVITKLNILIISNLTHTFLFSSQIALQMLS